MHAYLKKNDGITVSAEYIIIDAGLIVKVKRVAALGIPLSAYADDAAFKLFCVDVGLFGALANVDAASIIDGMPYSRASRGAMAEQYVRQRL